jgi:hypothetical protein
MDHQFYICPVSLWSRSTLAAFMYFEFNATNRFDHGLPDLLRYDACVGSVPTSSSPRTGMCGSDQALDRISLPQQGSVICAADLHSHTLVDLQCAQTRRDSRGRFERVLTGGT